MGGIPQEQGIPAPYQPTQPMVPASGSPYSGGWDGRRNCVLLEGCNELRTHAEPGQQLEGHQWHTVKKWSTSGETASSQAKPQRSGSSVVPSESPPPHRATEWWRGLPYPGNYLRPHHIQLNKCTKTGTQSSSTKYIETNTGRLPKWGEKETQPKWSEDK